MKRVMEPRNTQEMGNFLGSETTISFTTNILAIAKEIKCIQRPLENKLHCRYPRSVRIRSHVCFCQDILKSCSSFEACSGPSVVDFLSHLNLAIKPYTRVLQGGMFAELHLKRPTSCDTSHRYEHPSYQACYCVISTLCNVFASEQAWILWPVLIAVGFHRTTHADNWNINCIRDMMISLSIADDI
jgi:hypothetical protein